MSNKKKGQLTAASEWAKHLRKFGKRFFWKKERFAEKTMIKNEVKESNLYKSTENDTSIEVLKEKLSELKNLDKNFSIFGSEHHRYKFDSLISEKEIISFEKKHSFTLPKDYREFMLEFGNGGCGPHYGLFSLEKGILDLPQNPKQSDIIKLSKPFRFKTIWNMDSIKGTLDFKEEEYDNSKWADGMLRICHIGCGAFANIIVTGKEKGTIWIDDRVSEGGIYPVNNYNNTEKRYSFTEWYLSWLNNSITELKK
ncbi:SMI1/KNR4 family protein [Polaribacter sp.]|uniref:SMI1/KNR4 family protein n=1 Tax=Polaribacter sp. TaxID=1920175 RepID=UPI003EF226CC